MLCEKDGGHLATREELAQIASEIYVNEDGSPVVIGKNDDVWDLQLKNKYKVYPPLTFGYYWSSEETNALDAYYWYFNPSLTRGNDNNWSYKYLSLRRAICVSN